MTNLNHQTFTQSKSRGFSLIEVIVAALVMGIGLYGVLSLQAVALQQNQKANLYSQASFFANDLADRMRANKAAIASDQADYLVDGSNSVDCESNNCSAQNLADWDKFHWANNISESLPNGEGNVEIVDAEDDQFIITVGFQDPKSGSMEQVSVTVQI